MPNRILRDGILDSELVDRLGPEAEVLYRRLMSVVDDYGRFSADPRILRAKCYPLRVDQVRPEQISNWLASCVQAGLVETYAVEGKPYLLFLRLGTPRAKVSRYPPPPRRIDSPAPAAAPVAPPAPEVASPAEESNLERVAKATAARHANMTTAGVDQIARALLSAGAPDGPMLQRWDAWHSEYVGTRAPKFQSSVLKLIADKAWTVERASAAEEVYEP